MGRIGIKICILLVILTMSAKPSVLAQSGFKPILEGPVLLKNARWSSDSTQFIFQESTFFQGDTDYGVVSHTLNWHSFLVQTSELVRTDVWPLQPYLSPEQIDNYAIATLDDQISFLFPSPNARYLIYAAKPPRDWSMYYPLGIVDLQTREHRIIEDIVVNNLEEFTLSYEVIWSADSSSALVRTRGYDQLPFYITGLAGGLETLSFVSLYRDGVDIGEEHVLAWDAFAISSNGQQLLLANIDGYATRLFLWNTTQPAASQIIHTGRIFDAGFMTENAHHILYIAEAGLYKFDVLAGDSKHLLSTSSLAGEIQSAWISPDAQYIAIVTAEDAAPNRLYIIEVSILEH